MKTVPALLRALFLASLGFATLELRAAVVSATYNSAGDVPVTVASYTATGNTVAFTLNFAPAVGTELMVVKNTGTGFISGTFGNLTQGQAVALTFGGNTYNFVANYYGGTGNDLVLTWANTLRAAAWGNNGTPSFDSGQLGDGTATQRKVPVSVLASGVLFGKKIVALAAGDFHTLALCSDGTLAAWGSNTLGQLGVLSPSNSLVPVLVDMSGVLAGKRVVAIAAGFRYSLALCSDGTVAAWGDNQFGQLGNNSLVSSGTPVLVDMTSGLSALAGKTVIAIAAGYSHAIALCADGTLAAWGNNISGELGNNTLVASSLPVPVTTAGTPLAGKTVVAIAAGQRFSLALCSNGSTIGAWGAAGSCGNGNSTTDNLVPVAVSTTGPFDVLGGKTVVTVAAGFSYALALCSDGTLAAWGLNSFGSLGDNTSTDRNAPVLVNRVSGVSALAGKTPVAISTGSGHSLAMCSDGTAVAWGQNDRGQIGDNSTTQRNAPVAVSTANFVAGERFTRLVSGSAAGHTLALVAGTPVALPAIEVSGGSPATVIVNGATTTGTIDDTDFGTVVWGSGTPVTHTFTVKNIGTGTLNLTGAILPTTPGANPNDFIVVQPTITSLVANATTTFTVTFTPGGGGIRTATITIPNNASNPDTFAVVGNGTIAVGPGAVDPNYTPDANGQVYALAVQPDGKMVVGGFFTTLNGVVRNYAGRLNADGTLDSVFNPNPNSGVNCAIVQADGKIVLGGQFTAFGGATRNSLARVDTNGTLESGFDPNTNGIVSSMALQPDGKIIIAGNFTTVGGATRNRLARLNADGSLDTFNPNVSGPVNTVAVQPDGKIVFGGGFLNVGGVGRSFFARVNADGSLDALNPGVNAVVDSVAVQPDGKIVIGGNNFSTVGGVARNRLARITAAGALDTFDPGALNAVESMVLQTDQGIVIGGAFTNLSGATRNYIARLDGAGALDTVFNPNASSSVMGAALQADGKVVIGGGFTIVGGLSRSHLARLFNNPATQSLTVPSLSNVQWLRGGSMPETLQVTFELSTNGGASWTPLGAGTRITGGWNLTGLTLPYSGQVRARARTTSGYYNGSSGLVETIASYSIVAPAILVSGGNTPTVIAGGATATNITDGTDFGSVVVGTGAPVSHTFTITNSGTALLNLNGTPRVAVSGTNASEFAVTAVPSSTVAASNGTTTFTVTFTPTGTGPRTATISIPNDVTSPFPYSFAVSGNGTAPAIAVSGGSPLAPVSNGATTALISNGTNFGDVGLGANVTQVFTLTNSGSAPLHLTGAILVVAPGANLGDFAVTQPTLTTIPGNNGTTTFTVTFTPGAIGARTATISIPNDATTPNPYTFAVLGNGTAPAIIVTYGSSLALVGNGATTTLASNGTNFGNVGLGANAPQIFTIKNSGTSLLNLNGTPRVAVTGTNASEFAVTALPTATVAGSNGTTTFTVTFTPTGTGQRTATISIPNDASTPNPYTFAVSGNGTAPQMLVRGLSVTILNGDTTPTGGDNTHFGDVAVCTGATATHTFTIHNFGASPLLLNGSPIVVRGGANAGDFVVSQPTVTSLAGGGTFSTDFTVTFDPSGPGVRTATLSIANNDPTANPYTFTIAGNGIAPEIDLIGGSGNLSIATGNTTPTIANGTEFGSVPIFSTSNGHTFTIANLGTDALILSGTPNKVTVIGATPSEFFVSQPSSPVLPGGTTTFNVTFAPLFTGLRTATIRILNNDCDESTYEFTVQGTGTGAPEIEVRANLLPILSGDLIPSSADNTSFGSFAVSGGQTPPHTFTIHNLGSTALTINSIVSSNQTEFPITSTSQVLPATIAAGTTMTFNVAFDPSAAGLRTSNITIANDDSDEASYVFAVNGTGTVAQEIEVYEGFTTQVILNGDLSPGFTDNTDFGNSPVAGALIGPHYFHIRNVGNAPLQISSIIASNPAEFWVIGISRPLPASLVSGDEMFFSVLFGPTAAGIRTSNITIVNDDSDENPYVFAVQGNGTVAQEIEVRDAVSSLPILNGDLVPGLPDNTDFGNQAVSAGPTTPHTFTINNLGNAPLTISTITSNNAAEFTPGGFSQTLPAVITAGNTMSFNVRFDPNTTGPRTANITLINDDSDEGTYVFAVQGYGTGAPEIEVQDVASLLPILSGDVTPSTADHTRFGSVIYGGSSLATTFRIQNLGTAPLAVTNVSATTGSDFSVAFLGAPPPWSIPPGTGGFKDFTVTLTPTTYGLRTANIKIDSNDSDESSYVFAVEGTSSPPPKPNMAVSGNNYPVANGIFPPTSFNNTYYPNTAVVPSTTVVRTFRITNSGGALSTLVVGPVTLSGGTALPGEFAVTASVAAGTQIASGAFVDFDVSFTPSAAGLRWTTVNIGNNATPNSIYRFKIQGAGLTWTTAPEISVIGNNANIAAGSTTTSLTNHTNFGTKFVFNGSQTRTYTIQNIGGSPLSIGSVSKVGGNALPSEFTILTQPTTPVNGPTGTTTFTVKFDPALAGTRTTTLTFGTNDTTGGENPFTFTISGKGSWWPVAGSGWLRRSANAGWMLASDLYGSARVLEVGDDFEPALGAPRSFAWGGNAFGQLGNASTSDSALAVAVSTTGVLAGRSVVDLAVGRNHSVALSADGTLAAWGQGSSGQLGTGSTTNSSVPLTVTTSGALAGKTVVALAAGQIHSLALCADGTVVAWGGNTSGQLGNGTTANSSVPVAVNATGALAGKTVMAIAAGDQHSVALCSDGTVFTWGANTYGQLGNGTTTDSSVPVAARTSGAASALAGRTIVAIAAGASHTLVTCADGAVAAWGRNASGQLGDNSTTDRNVPVFVNTAGVLAGKTVVAMAAGASHSLALCADDTVVAWGDNAFGQLGINSTINSLVPAAVLTTGDLLYKTVVGVTAGDYHSVVLCSDGTLEAWGRNTNGQLGTNGTTDSPVPLLVNHGATDPDARFTRIYSGATAARTVALAASPTPLINLSGNGLSILNGSSPSAAASTDFGSAVTNGGSVVRNFTISNSGAGILNLTGTPKVAVSGINAADFSVSQQPVSPVAGLGGTTTIAVTFSPVASGLRLATLTLATDDLTQGTYTFDVQGTGSAAGNLDPTVNPSPNNLVYTTAIQPDGKNVLGGNFTGFGAGTPNRAARLETDGTLDLTFNPDANNLVASALVQTDGAIVLGGTFTTVGGVARNRLARVDGNGILDTAFNPDANGAINALAVQTDGKLIVAGGFTTIGGVTRNKIARLNGNGTLDTTFDPNVNRDVYTAAMQADGKILIGGNFDTVSGVTRNRFARLNANGTLDTAFDPNINSDVTSLAVQADGRIVFGGQFTTVGGVPRNRVARVNSVGALDTGYDPNVDSAVYSLAAQTDGKIIIGGAFNNVGGISRTRIARLNANGTPDTSFTSSTEDLVFSTALQADGKVVIAGYFFTVGGVSSRSLARLDNDNATQSLTVTAANRVQWLRSGTSPETVQVTFEFSADGGNSWSPLGAGSRLAISPGWELTGLSLAGDGLIRARARTTGGAYSGSSGLVETITAYSFATIPVITTQPVSQAAATGATVTFNVTATGTSPFTYQWKKGNAAGNVAIPGATNATLTLTNVQAADAASYQVVVTNSVGSTSSSAANLSVTVGASAPVITTQPVARTVTAGGNVTFAVVATGTPALAYQWRTGGVAIGGETNSTLIFAGVAAADAGSYDVVVSNSAGPVTSNAVLLTVNTPPAIAMQPVSMTGGTGTGVAFNASATGTSPLTYQWSKDGTDISGATTPSLALGNLALTDSGLYRLTVRNVVGTAVSNPAQLTVLDAFPTHSVSGPGYIAGGTVTIVNQLTYGATTSGLGWQLLVPAGWSYASGSGNEGDVKPVVGTTNLIEWAWTAIPTGPLTFSYTLNVPAGTTGAQQLTALAIIRQTGVTGQILAKPDPLVVSQVTRHSADTDSNQRIDLAELTRVIALYNTRNGTVRTGAYGVVAVSEDGFAPDPNRANGAVVTLSRYHSGDTDLNGKLSLVELTRVIELYNVRSGTTRTGAYHPQSGTEDGFAPGP